MLNLVEIYSCDGVLVDTITLSPHSRVIVQSTNDSTIEVKNDEEGLGIIVDAFDIKEQYYNSITYLYEDLEAGVW